MKKQPFESNSSVTFLTVDQPNVGQRIDNFLIAHLRRVPRSHVYRILHKGEVRVNKHRIKPCYRLQLDDTVRIPPVYQRPKHMGQADPEQLDKLYNKLEERIIFEDQDMIALNKPSGLAVHQGSTLAYGVIDIMRHGRPTINALELVHRLDRSTSGLLLLAKSRMCLCALHELLKGRNISKKYTVLVAGQVRQAKQTVRAPLARQEGGRGQRTMIVNDAGKPASTCFHVLRHYPGATLLAAQILSGRTHQIRAHAAHIGHPVVGDREYGYDKEHKKQLPAIKRIFLHASELQFSWQKNFTFKAPLAEELSDYLTML